MTEDDTTKARKLYNIFKSKKLIILDQTCSPDYKLDSIWKNYLETIGVKLVCDGGLSQIIHTNLSFCVPDSDHRFPLSTILVPRNLADKILMLGGLP